MDAAYSLQQIVGGIPHLAEVRVTVSAASQDEVAVSAGAFDWRRSAYGPRAVVDAPGDRLLAAQAVEGVRYVLARLPVRDGGYRVSVTRVWDTPADTSAGDIKLAAALALCVALGVHLDPPPRLESAAAVFPD